MSKCYLIALKFSKSNLNDFVDLPANITVRDVLQSKQPSAASLYCGSLITSTDPTLSNHNVIFEALDGVVICAAALHFTCATGPLDWMHTDGDNYVLVLSQPLMNHVAPLLFWKDVSVHHLLIVPLLLPLWLAG